MADDVTEKIVNVRFRTADTDREATLTRTTVTEDDQTWDQWTMAGADGATIASFPDADYDAAKQAAIAYLATLKQADTLRAQADAMESEAAQTARDTAAPARPAPVEEATL